MALELGGSQISQLLETVPGIRSVLRSPVADAIVNTIRAAAGIEELELADVRELIQYAVRRGLVSADEGDRVLDEVEAALGRRGRRKKAAQKQATKRPKAGVKKGAARRRPVKKSAPRAKRR